MKKLLFLLTLLFTTLAAFASVPDTIQPHTKVFPHGDANTLDSNKGMLYVTGSVRLPYYITTQPNRVLTVDSNGMVRLIEVAGGMKGSDSTWVLGLTGGGSATNFDIHDTAQVVRQQMADSSAVLRHRIDSTLGLVELNIDSLIAHRDSLISVQTEIGNISTGLASKLDTALRSQNFSSPDYTHVPSTSAVNALVSNYALTSWVTAQLSNYYTKTQSDLLYQPNFGTGSNGTFPVMAAGVITWTNLVVRQISASDATMVFTTGGGGAVQGRVGLITTANISATGTPSATTFYRGDGAWATPVSNTYTAGRGLGLNGFQFYVDTTFVLKNVVIKSSNVLHTAISVGTNYNGVDTIQMTLNNQNPHLFLASSVSTATTTPTFRGIDSTDLPANVHAANADILKTGRNINGVLFNGSSDITVHGFVGVQVFTVVGAFTYTPTAGTKRIIVKMWGGGGGSAAAKTSISTPGTSGGGESGAPALYVVGSFTWTSTTGSVGAGGSAGCGTGSCSVSPTNGGNGGNSIFIDGTNTVTATGGTGSAYSATGSAVPIKQGASGSVATGGTINGYGNKGANAVSTSTSFYMGGDGGATLEWGGGGVGAVNTAAAGGAGRGYGAGAGGSCSAGSSQIDGAAGMSGIVVIYEYN